MSDEKSALILFLFLCNTSFFLWLLLKFFSLPLVQFNFDTSFRNFLYRDCGILWTLHLYFYFNEIWTLFKLLFHHFLSFLCLLSLLLHPHIQQNLKFLRWLTHNSTVLCPFKIFLPVESSFSQCILFEILFITVFRFTNLFFFSLLSINNFHPVYFNSNHYSFHPWKCCSFHIFQLDLGHFFISSNLFSLSPLGFWKCGIQ